MSRPLSEEQHDALADLALDIEERLAAEAAAALAEPAEPRPA